MKCFPEDADIADNATITIINILIGVSEKSILYGAFHMFSDADSEETFTKPLIILNFHFSVALRTESDYNR